MARKLRRRLGIDAEVGNLTGTTMNVRKLIVPPKSTPFWLNKMRLSLCTDLATSFSQFPSYSVKT